MKSLSLPKSLVPALLALITLHFATATSAAVPTSAQMKSAMSPFEFLKNVKTSDLKSVGGTRQARFKMGSEETTLVGYIPNGSRRVILGLVTRKAAIGKFIGGALAKAVDDIALRDVTVLLVPQDSFKTADMPKILRDSIKPVASEFQISTGITLFARLAGKPVGIVGVALNAIGLNRYDDIGLQAKAGPSLSLLLKKTAPWNNPFRLKKVNNRTTSLEGLTVRISGTKKKPAISSWGQVNLNGKKYFFFAKQEVNPKKPKNPRVAYGLDARTITLKTIADFAAAMPWSNDLATKGLGKLPLDQIKITNPRYTEYDAAGDAPPSFEKMIIVAASPGIKVPDRKPLPGTAGKLKGTYGPLLYANGTATVFGKTVGNVMAEMSLHGLKADADVGLNNIGPIRFSGRLRFQLGPKGGNKKYDHEMKLTGKAGIHGLPKQTIILKADVQRLGYHIPASCPLNPCTIKGSVPMVSGMALNGIKDFEISIGISDCFTDAILGLAKDPTKVANFAKNLAEDQIVLGVAAATAIGAGIVNADKTLKSAWKGSIDAGQTAANTVKNLDKKVANLGTSIHKVGKSITKLSDGIKSIGKSIAKAFTSVTGLKKKRKRKKRERAAKQSEKR